MFYNKYKIWKWNYLNSINNTSTKLIYNTINQSVTIADLNFPSGENKSGQK